MPAADKASEMSISMGGLPSQITQYLKTQKFKGKYYNRYTIINNRESIERKINYNCLFN